MSSQASLCQGQAQLGPLAKLGDITHIMIHLKEIFIQTFLLDSMYTALVTHLIGLSC